MDKIKIQVLEKPDKNWDKRVIENNGDIYQTTTYAKFQEKCLNMESEFLLAIKDSKIVGQLVITYGPRFAKYLNKGKKKLFKFFSRHFKIYTFIRGPIIIDKKVKKEIYLSFLDYLDNNKKNCFIAQDISLPIEEEEAIYKLFYEKGFYSDSWGTVIIDTSKSEEDLFSSISRNQRRQIKKALQIGLKVKEAKIKRDYNKVIKIINEMCRQNKIFVHPSEYYHSLFEVFNSTSSIKTFYIEHNKKLIATASVYLTGKKAARAFVGHTKSSLQEKIPGMPFIEWFVIKWVRDNGYKNYDLTGIRPLSGDSKEKGIREYKLRWGGREIHYPYFSKKYSKTKFALIELLRTKWKKKLVTKWK
jgi:lipid II:glycine glycyltransferase (peptidoglycan interpeptide bridge formation enzyme)